MPEDLDVALAALRPLLLDAGPWSGRWPRAAAAAQQPAVHRAELRPVDLKAGRRCRW